MKDSLEDLLKQVYGQKEVPSQEFSQTVLQKMRERDGKSFFWKRGVACHKGFLAASICAGMFVLAGLGVIYWQGGLRNMGTSLKQDLAERETPMPAATEDPVGVSDRVETKNPTDAENQAKTEDPTDTENQVETDKPSDLENKAEADQMLGNRQKYRKDPSHSFAGKRDSGFQVQGQHPTAKPENQNTGTQRQETEQPGSDADMNSGNQKPTAAPQIPLGFIPPSKTVPPQNTPRPLENYISLCSIETYSCSLRSQSSSLEEVVSVPESVLSNQLIRSYEQLQTVIQELENLFARKTDDSLQELFIQLKGYDQEYFASNALCLSTIFLQKGMDLKLHAVWIRDMGQGNYCLDIWLDKVYDKSDPPSSIQFYSSLVCVPQNIAGQCNIVQFQYLEKE